MPVLDILYDWLNFLHAFVVDVNGNTQNFLMTQIELEGNHKILK